ncbi:hypothetical protein HK098_005153 [Nowakowskiella sp. JEL0407]|nr:hypothetical protein HK098_005153 [Nowakowskiella sp. JEL0407]
MASIYSHKRSESFHYLPEPNNFAASFAEEKEILVLGAGNFGTCLSDHLACMCLFMTSMKLFIATFNFEFSLTIAIALNKQRVTVWARDKAVVDSINQFHKNSKYLKDITLDKNVVATNSIDKDIFQRSSVVLMSVPTQYMRSILHQIKPLLTPQHLLICVNKGIEISTLELPHEILSEELGKEISEKAVFLSGPSFAIEVAKRQITCVSAASQTQSRALRTQKLFHAPYFRVYSTSDITGVEIAGALKNVIAVAAGACAGLDLQMNSRAALITRGLAEIARIGVAMGANPLTFSGLAGVGDLFLTCTSEKSRNYTVGYRIGRGEKLDYVLETLGSVAEGVETTRAAYHLGRKLKVDTPQIDAVYSVLFEGVNINKALKNLIERDPSEELKGLDNLTLN